MCKTNFYTFLHFLMFDYTDWSKNKIEPIEPIEPSEPKLDLSSYLIAVLIQSHKFPSHFDIQRWLKRSNDF